jgi:hypothetical protein
MDPREQFQRIQRSLQNSGRGFGGGAAGPGGRAVGGLLLLGAAGIFVSNALFNGMMTSPMWRQMLMLYSRGWSQSYQVHQTGRREAGYLR